MNPAARHETTDGFRRSPRQSRRTVGKNGCGCRGRTDRAWVYETRRNNWFYPQKLARPVGVAPTRSELEAGQFAGTTDVKTGHDGGIRTRDYGLCRPIPWAVDSRSTRSGPCPAPAG